MGARPLKRAIQRHIEDPLADFVLGRSIEPGSTILVNRSTENEDEVTIDVIPGAPPVEAEKVTVPPEEPKAEDGDGGSDDEQSD
jgi:ATP-dependent Clp protease ATP-binding subunit ClpC